MFKARNLRDATEAALVRRPKGLAVVRPLEVLQHELEVYQIELEIQYEALRSAQLALEESRDRYVDLHEFVPVGYPRSPGLLCADGGGRGDTRDSRHPDRYE